MATLQSIHDNHYTVLLGGKGRGEGRAASQSSVTISHQSSVSYPSSVIVSHQSLERSLREESAFGGLVAYKGGLWPIHRVKSRPLADSLR